MFVYLNDADEINDILNYMTLDVAVDVRETSQTPPTPEKRKWGFHVQRDTDSVNTLARFFSTTSDPNSPTTDPNYRKLRELTQMQCAQDPELSLHKTRNARDPGGVLSLLQENYEGFDDSENMDRIAYLTHISEMFDFTTWNKKARLYNFSEISLTDEQLFQIGDALGEMNSEFGGEPMDYLSNIVIVPDGHPILWSNGQPKSDSTSIFEDNMIVINAKFLEARRLPVQSKGSSTERPFHAGGNTLKTLIKHEFGHLWATAHDEKMQVYEKKTRGEIPPTKYAEALDRNTGRPLEDFPETLVADTHPEHASHIGPDHKREMRSLREETYPKVSVEYDGETVEESVAGPTIVTCRQLNPESFAHLSSAVPRSDKFWIPHFAQSQESFSYSVAYEFEEAALTKLANTTDSSIDVSQGAEKKSRKIGRFRLSDEETLQIIHLVIERSDDYTGEDMRAYPREDTIVEVISNKPDKRGIYQSEGLRITRRKDGGSERTHLQRITAAYKSSEGGDDMVTLPDVNQYKVDFSGKPLKDKEIREMIRQIQ